MPQNALAVTRGARRGNYKFISHISGELADGGVALGSEHQTRTLYVPIVG